jgi:hypothetical protein
MMLPNIPILSTLLVVLQIHLSTQAAIEPWDFSFNGKYPRRVIAGISVIDTPIVRAAQELARNHSSDFTYGHVMRSWLFGTALIASNATLRKEVDMEVHAVAAILHDLGWDQTPESPFVTPDRRFEIDGAIAARQFIRDFKTSKRWDETRERLVWEAIAFHTTPGYTEFMDPEIQMTARGIQVEWFGLDSGINETAYEGILAGFNNTDFKEGLLDTLTWLCRTKPATTYDSALQPFGENHVPGYSAVGHRIYDRVFPNSTES